VYDAVRGARHVHPGVRQPVSRPGAREHLRQLHRGADVRRDRARPQHGLRPLRRLLLEGQRALMSGAASRPRG